MLLLTTEESADILPEINRVLPLPEPADSLDDEDRRLARDARLRLWRSGPAMPEEVHEAVAAELAAEAAHRQGPPPDAAATEARVDRIAALLASDATIAEPPDADEADLILSRLRTRFAEVHRPHARHDCINGLPPAQEPDQYGCWPGVHWRRATRYSLAWAGETDGPLSTSGRAARLLLEREVMATAEATAEAEEQARRAAFVDAREACPQVFDDDRQELLLLAVGLHARGDLPVPASGDPVAEASLLAELEHYDVIGLTTNQRCDVCEALVRIVAERGQPVDRIEPRCGYGIRLGEHREVVGLCPGLLTAEAGPRHITLRSPRWPKPVRLSKRDFRDPRKSGQAIFEQAGAAVDLAFWRRWWPGLAQQLLLAAAETDDGIDVDGWQRWIEGIVARAPHRQTVPDDGRAYVSPEGRLLASKAWIVQKAISDGLIHETDAEGLSRWLGAASLNRRDEHGNQRRVLPLPVKPPLIIRGIFEADEKNAVAGSNDAKTPEKQE